VIVNCENANRGGYETHRSRQCGMVGSRILAQGRRRDVTSLTPWRPSRVPDWARQPPRTRPFEPRLGVLTQSKRAILVASRAARARVCQVVGCPAAGRQQCSGFG
jgi:hypothetical protein